MNRFKLLSIFLLICFLTASIQQMVVEGGEGYSYGMHVGGLEESLGKKSHVYLMYDLMPKLNDSIYFQVENLKTGEQLSILPNRATLISFCEDAHISSYDKMLTLFNGILNIVILLLYFYFLILFVKIFISFSRARVFEERNIRRLNLIGIGFVVMGVLSTIYQLVRIYVASHAIELSNFEITYSKVIDWNNIIVGLIILLMTEILRMATSMKREQELTI